MWHDAFLIVGTTGGRSPPAYPLARPPARPPAGLPADPSNARPPACPSERADRLI